MGDAWAGYTLTVEMIISFLDMGAADHRAFFIIFFLTIRICLVK